MARPKINVVELNEEQFAKLKAVTNSRTEAAGKVNNARILLMAHEGLPYKDIAEALHTSRQSVHHVVKKFLAFGVEGAVSDLARSGRPAKITDEDKIYVINLACIKPKELGYPHELWSLSLLQKHIHEHCHEDGHPVLEKIAKSKVWKILDEQSVKPHKIRYYLEKRDPDFEAKKEQVLMLYKEAQLQLIGCRGADNILISYDEKPGIQAIGCSGEDRPISPEHGFIGRDSEYKRFGTLSLLAGINLITGEISYLIRDSHKSSDFVDFLKVIDAQYPAGRLIKVVLDNHKIHSSKETMAYLNTVPGRFEFIFTPKHGSWLNMIEGWFSKLSRCLLRGMRVKSKEELKQRISLFIDDINQEPVPHHWTYKMDEINL